MITHRRHFGGLLNNLGLTGQAVEVGVNHAANAAQFLSVWKGRCLHLVDPWRQLAGYRDVLNEGDRERDLHAALRNLRPHDGRYALWRMLSGEAARHFADQSLDYVYIDADHSQAGCAADIAVWWPKVRLGGILAGHDYHEFEAGEGVVKVPRGELLCGVAGAVDGFVQRHGLQLHVTHELQFNARGECVAAPSWLVRKPE